MPPPDILTSHFLLQPCPLLASLQNTAKGEKVSFYRFPPKSEPVKRQQWLNALNLAEGHVQDHHRICSHHFPNGDASQLPSLNIGKKFASPKKLRTPRGERALMSAKRKSLFCNPRPTSRHRSFTSSPSPCSSNDVTAAPSEVEDEYSPFEATPHSTPIGEVLLSDYSVHELPGSEESMEQSVSGDGRQQQLNDRQTMVVNTALVARIESLEAENRSLRMKLATNKPRYFRLEDISNNDSLVRFYTGFYTYETLLTFYDFLGPSVNSLTYWRSKSTKTKRQMKLDPLK